MTHVSITNLSKTYPGAALPSLDRLSLEIASGELTALLGPSGCGKTTTMRMIAGILPPPSGTVEIADRKVLLEVAPDVFDRVHRVTPGSIVRQDAYRQRSSGTLGLTTRHQ